MVCVWCNSYDENRKHQRFRAHRVIQYAHFDGKCGRERSNRICEFPGIDNQL